MLKKAHSLALKMLQEPTINQNKPNWFLYFFTASIIFTEILGCLIIIRKIAYTEIDWVAYMQEVAGYLRGEYNYYKLRGDTGPLVYPAGFVYVYSALYHLTEQGQDIQLAQYIFMGIYLLQLAVVLAIYSRSGGIPCWVLLLLSLSKRVHSIFVLRCFNDGIAMLLLYISILIFTWNKWKIGCAVFSLAVSIKMNILLFAPGLLLLLLQSQGVVGAIPCLAICASIQVLLGLPFLSRHPIAYLHRSFELGRVFMFKWTVNFKFLSEETFTSKALSIYLLIMMVLALVAFSRKWLRSVNENSISLILKDGPKPLNAYYIVLTMFASNFIGIVFARTLHYQFYCWYFHALPLLLWHCRLPTWLRLMVLASIEYAFNVYPATSESSIILQLSHILILVALWLSPIQNKLHEELTHKTR